MTVSKLHKLRESNATRNASLNAQNVQLHPMSIMDAKLDAIVAALGTEAELHLEEVLSGHLDRAEETLVQQKLVAGLTLPNFGKDSK